MRPIADQIHTREQLQEFIKQNGLTKLQALKAAHAVWDPLSLLLTLKSNLSLAYRELLVRNPEMKYEDFIPVDQLDTWKIVIGNLLDAKKVTIPRFRTMLHPTYLLMAPGRLAIKI